MPRIALVTSSYHPHVGGVEEHVRHVSAGLRSRGVAVEIWSVDRGDGLREAVVEECRVRYLPTPLPARAPASAGRFLLDAPGAATRWLRAYRDFRPDVINIQCFGPNGLYGVSLARLTRTPLVVSSHGETFADEHGAYDRSALLRAGLRRAVRSARTTTACSPFVAQDLVDRFGATDVVVIPNGVTREPPPDVDPVPAAESPVLIGVGRLVPQKGFDTLLDAAARSRHSPHVWVVGDGAQKAPLEERARALGIGDRVRFLGRRSPAEVQALMRAASVVVVPSRAEAFGIVVLEAWMSGTPLVATSRGGPGTLVTDGEDGLLVDPEDTAQVADTVDRVLDDPSLASNLAHAGLHAVEAYTWAETLDRYTDLFSEELSRQGSAGRRGPGRRARK